MTRELLIAGRFKVVGKIGGGSFGDIYEGFDIKRGESVAIKLEKAMNKSPMLKYEANVLRLLNKGKRSPGIPEMHYSGPEGEFEVMVITLCGPSLEDLNNYCFQKLTVNTVCMVADQILKRLQFLHAKNFIHRDLKPENFVMGVGSKAHQVYMIDYGLAKRYCDPKTQQHVPHTTGKPLVGTTRYASVNAHLGIEQSRRDDLEGLGMVLVYLALASLPWQGMQADTRAEKERKIMERKIMSKPAILCATLPKCFEQYLTYARSLKYEQEPDYAYCRKIFSDEYDRRNRSSYNWVYDWDVMFKQRQAAGMVETTAASQSSNKLLASAKEESSGRLTPAGGAASKSSYNSDLK